MTEINKSYRIRTKIGDENPYERLEINEDLVQEYDSFEILSVNITSQDAYRLHNSNHGIVVGRVLANNGFGIPNAKVSIFVKNDGKDNVDIRELYPYDSSVSKNSDGVRYNLLPNEQVDGCHQVVGTFPTKRYALDNDVILEIFDKYYKYTAKTNNAGDYLICGVPVGSHTLHMDLDLSDCGILSQRPRDFVYKGYTIEQFESPTKFKSGTDYENLSQIFSQDQVVNVTPFWGNASLGETIGLTRADISVNFKFEPTCVFMGSIISDNSSNGFTRKCIATDNMGMMEELVTGEGTIEMIRKTPGGSVEEFSIKGNKLINDDGVWCYQIPMNLDYMATDEYGNMVPTDNPEKGIPTRASVRFRISMDDHEENSDNFLRGKVLVPHNPQVNSNGYYEDYDYNFGTYTKESSFRDLFWNNVYSVKSFIPRIQKHKNPKRVNYTGIKSCNHFGGNNPMPYNNIRIRMPLLFMILCVLIKCYVLIIKIYNTVLTYLGFLLAKISTKILLPKFSNGDGWLKPWTWCLYFRCALTNVHERLRNIHLVVLKDGLCPDLENWFFAPSFIKNTTYYKVTDDCKCINLIGTCCGSDDSIIEDYDIIQQTLDYVRTEGDYDDPTSIDDQNSDDEETGYCLTKNTDYLISCIEMNLAQEYKVINFDFYNDWINGTIYNPRWAKYSVVKRKFLWWSLGEKVRGCMDNTKIFSTARKYTQQCSIGYELAQHNGYDLYTSVEKPNLNSPSGIRESNRFHKRIGMKQARVFGHKGGVCHEEKTLKGQNVYYLKPCEYDDGYKSKLNLFATDIILLGTFNDCDINGIPQAFKHLTSSTYVMPTNLALTNMDTNGPLYGDNKNTFCVQKITSSTGDVLTNGITELQGSAMTLESEFNFYGNSKNYSLDESKEYPNGIELDTLPITEAAGISWNFTGPGQGEKKEKHMYYPGGHFLGLSCINSQTNIKSCINLSRICEIGTVMSQRKEIVDGIKDLNGKKQLTHVYIAPSGFISENEIIDSDFRSMFATMNKKRLIATKINSKTGYKYYDFEFSNAINFDGSFSRTIKGSASYNQTVIVNDEDLTRHGIIRGENRDDYDVEESGKTIIKTKEFTDVDYYLFRFGIPYNSVGDTNLLKRKFLKHEDKQYLPQYDNSYYFYFGLTNGSTALEEFNKQFYSECEILSHRPEKKFNLEKTFSFCDGYGEIFVNTTGYAIPFKRIIIEKKFEPDFYQVIEGNAYSATLISENFQLIRIDNDEHPERFDLGTYAITIVDADNDEVSGVVSLGDNLISYDIEMHNFNIPLYENYISANTAYLNDGGYLEINNFNINGVDLANDFYNIDFVINYSCEALNSTGYTFESYDGGTVYLPGLDVVSANTVSAKYVCELGGEEHEIVIGSFKFNDNKYVQLKAGNEDGYSRHLIYNLKYDSTNQEDVPYLGECKPQIVLSKNSEINNDNCWWNQYEIGKSIDTNASEELNEFRWFFRSLLFDRENNPENPFKIKIYAKNGKRIIWGRPQNNESVYREAFCTGDSSIEIPEGFALDDSTIYIPTYGRISSSLSGQYSTIAINDNDVCGEYKGTYVNGDVNFNGVSQYYANGYGCVFKSIPDGKIKCMFYDDTNDYENMKAILSDAGFTRGIFYPTFIYPDIDRPFKISVNYVYWSKLYSVSPVEGEEQNNFNSLYPVNSNNRGRVISGVIKNGITYSSNGSTAGTMSILNINGFNPNNAFSGSDCIAMSVYTNFFNRYFRFNNYEVARDEYVNDDQLIIGFDIKEGELEGQNAGLSKRYVMNEDIEWPDAIYAEIEHRQVNGTDYDVITGLTPSNAIDNDIKYYLCRVNADDSDNFFIKTMPTIYKTVDYVGKQLSNQYNTSDDTIDGTYVFEFRGIVCKTYNNNVDYSSITNLDEALLNKLNGREVTVKVKIPYDGEKIADSLYRLRFMKINIEFDYFDDSDNESRIVKSGIFNYESGHEPTISFEFLTQIDNAIKARYLFNLFTGFTQYFPLQPYVYKTFSTENTNFHNESYGKFEYDKIIKKLLNNSNNCVAAEDLPNNNFTQLTQEPGDNDTKRFAIAVKTYTDENLNQINTYKVYTQIRGKSNHLKEK